MCAAPGSKTFQLLEMLHDLDGSATGAGAAAADSSGGNTPAGFVVANDADAQRCNLLTHQTKRMCSPCLMVTNHEGQVFPRISAAAAARPAPRSAAAAAGALAGALAAHGGSAEAAAASGGSSKPVKDDFLLFDRILADVPCSGDGTMRKAPDIWRRWTVANGNGLHIMQLKIALQAARLLQVRV
jgi:16S rRNA C967 or C1407 C5-methylase (RsmB/RsmF family)